MLGAYIPALIGLGGVIVALAGTTVWQNRLENKKADIVRKLDLERIEHDRRVLRSGLRAELSFLIGLIRDEEKFVRTDGSPIAFVPILNWFAFYQANLEKLGLLSEDEVFSITRSFYYIRERAVYIIRWGEDYVVDTQSGTASVKFDLVNWDRKKRLLDKLYDIRVEAERSLAVIEGQVGSHQQTSSIRRIGSYW